MAGNNQGVGWRTKMKLWMRAPGMSTLLQVWPRSSEVKRPASNTADKPAGVRIDGGAPYMM